MIEALFTYMYPLLTFTSCFAYLPQIKELAVAKSMPTGLSLMSWIIWMGESFISAGYGIFHLHDALFCLLSLLDLALIGSVLGLALYLNYIKYPQKQSRTRGHAFAAGDIGQIVSRSPAQVIAFQPHEAGLY